MNNKKKLISIVVPCFNEETNVLSTYKSLKIELKKNLKYNHELIFVDNGSKDRTKVLIKNLAKKDKKVIGVFLSRNFGPEASGQAGYDIARGDAIMGFGCDLQDPPEMISKCLKKWEQGYDMVLGIYTKADGNLIMKTIRILFYKIFKFISNTSLPQNATGFGLIDKRINITLKSLPEKYRFGRGLMAWIGFKKYFILYKRRKREKGKSTYNIFDYIKHAERGIFGFSYLILDLMVYGGFILVFFSFLFIVGYLYTVIVIGNPINASIPLMLGIVFFGGIQLLAISIIGKYIQVIVEETKNRPMYIVEETINI